MNTIIYYQGRRYYYFDTFDDWERAKRTITSYRKRYKKRNSRLRYHVQIYEGGLLYPRKRYRVYFDKVRRLFS